MSLLTSTLLTIRMSVLTTTVDPIKSYKISPEMLPGYIGRCFQRRDCFHRFINPLSALTLCLADTVQLIDKFR